ncbi:uncharacterized protein LOC125239818 [Leguminivora glycinivorella]|uniref:uncharacterized protein LOC125239818 n=1 Tax=Leguminivora glycinivorella TaxID=1035111 RepID=UPI0020104B80|nr:uncharacterized protein LOC125239818 [Leguminivora glycinivorella]
MVPRIFREGICRPSKFRRLHKATRGFCKTDWTKPRHLNKPYTEHRSDLPLVVQNNPGQKSVRYGELWKAWFAIEYELINSIAKNGKVTAPFLFDYNRNDGIKTYTNIEKKDDVSKDEGANKDEGINRRHVDAILRTYSELQAYSSPMVKKSGFVMLEEKGPEDISAATVNVTTKNVEDEKLEQKLESIEEVPLVEADPDIIKPPQTSGPVVMNMSSSDIEEFARHSDFQISDEPDSASIIHYHYQVDRQKDTNFIKNYFEKDSCRKSNITDLITLNAVPEIKDEEELSLMDLMQRVRQKNRLIRCRDIECQLNASATDENVMADRNTNFPQHQFPYQQPGWAWPTPTPFPHHPHRHPSPMYPHVASPHPRKAEPITPDNRPGYNRATKVNPVTLALYLGPLVTAFRNASILFPLLTASLISKTSNKDPDIDNICVLHSCYEKESGTEN